MPDTGWSAPSTIHCSSPWWRASTLRDAGNYIAKLFRREHDAAAWCAVVKALMLSAEQEASQIEDLAALEDGRVIKPVRCVCDAPAGIFRAASISPA